MSTCSRLGWGFQVDWTNWTVCLFAWRCLQLTTGKYCVHFMLPPMLLSGNFYAIVFACRLQIWHLVNVLFSCKFVNTCFCAGEWMLTDHKYQNLKEKINNGIQCTAVSCKRPFSIFEMRTRIHSFQSRTSRREQEFFQFCVSMRIPVSQSRASIEWLQSYDQYSNTNRVVQTWAVKLESK